ncbi:MAG: peptidase S41, partial [Bacteroidales bacterium]|nr:peptidase S41 [Bacteroidales bacterium]
GLILDLRGNGGGLMDQAVDIVNLFLPKGELIVETKGKIASKNMKSFTRMAPIDTEIPVAVLMDGSSASASEITAGSLQDLDRAIIIGHRSYGKGLVQNILPMSYNTQMKVTVSKYYIPSGRCIQAIDYAHRDADGKAIKVPDSLKTAYKTRAGRTVYDGFGIEPDVELPVEYMSTLAMALESKQLVFEYATQFYYAHPTIDSADKFVITDEIYNDFKQFLASKDYSYKTVTESILSDLREAAKEEEYLESIGAEIDRLEARFKADKQSDLDRHRDEIADLLRAEIVTRYYYNRGCLKAMLTTDPFVAKAVEVLSDKAQYNKLLGK